ncbi:hypothetical protein BN8_02266 [Fibrisoma limi BUZ 3]|uniref:Uncharacterized protein n=1 Tax=Fibrisoma limi BUZ 3 TaxID=1185876 RepID=I2GH15_9BACT|nr:hypothetical protein BN8_02266 [Fibrisoma limi BUZ 3]
MDEPFQAGRQDLAGKYTNIAEQFNQADRRPTLD